MSGEIRSKVNCCLQTSAEQLQVSKRVWAGIRENEVRAEREKKWKVVVL